MEHGGISTGSRDASDTNRGGGIVTDSPASAATTSADTRSSEEDGQATESIASNGGEVTVVAAAAATTDDGRSDVRKPLGAAVKHEATESPEILQGKQGEAVVTSAIPSGNRDAPAAAAAAVFEGSTVVPAVIETTTTVAATVEEDAQVREREACDKLVKMRAEKQAIIKGQ